MNLDNFYQISEYELQQLKDVELDILKKVISVIESLKLNYFAVGGTALGAFKYAGFIPWDDDIDIAMPREDFLRFVEEAPKILPDYLSLQSVYNDKNYTLGVAKVRNENTTFFDIYTAHQDISHGIFIDIFPIDFCGCKMPNKSIIYKMRENKIAYSGFYKPDNSTTKNKMKSLICRAFLLFKSPHECALLNDKFLIKINKKNQNSKRSFMRIEQHKSSYFTGDNLLDFCDIKIRVPNNIEEYLKNCYGDIKHEPPIEKRYPHHYLLCLDFNRSYKEYYFANGKVILQQ